MRPAAILVVIAFLVACKADDRPRFVAAADHFSVVELPGWTADRELGTVVFHGPATLGDGRVTIAVRSVPLVAARADARTPRRVIASTQTVLAALPGAEVGAPVGVASAGYQGARFDLTFARAAGGGARYRRRHVVLVAPDRHIFQVFLTAPAAEAPAFEQALPLLDDVVATLRREA